MPFCEYCGFDGHTPGESCAVCGASGGADVAELNEGAELTEVLDTARAPTLRRPERPIAPTAARIAERSLFKDRYRIDRTLGRGGMGAVYRATDLQTDRLVALKVLHLPTRVEESPFQRFQREVRILRRIDHPLIPRIHDAGLHDDKMYLVTDLIEGETLREAIATRGHFPSEEVARIGSFIAQGIDVAHHNGVIHRDIKPHNVMLTPTGEIRLLDFGIARDVATGAKSITESGMMVGTPEYMSPEQFQGEKIDARTDIYSLGVLLYQIATGALPFTADTAVALGIKHVSESPVQPRKIVPEIAIWLNRIILKCLEKRREDRYPTAGDLATDLQTSSQRRRRIQRTRSGDFIIEDDSDDSWALVVACREERNWPEGATLLLDPTYYRLELREFDETMPAPWVYRFSFWREGEVIRKLIEWDPEQPPSHRKESLTKWFKR